MARPKQHGPRRVVRRLSDGTTWIYLYDRDTGAAVGKHLAEDHAAEVRPGTVAALVAEYRASNHFKTRKPRTREAYNRSLVDIQNTIGDQPVTSITAGAVQRIKEGFADTPSKANQTLALLSILFTRAIKSGLITTNPATRPGKLEVRKRSELWSREEQDRYMAAFRPRLRLLFSLMLFTLQRLSDVLAMTKNQVVERDGRLYIVLRQHKTNALVGLPVHSSLEPLLRERMAETVMRKVTGGDGKVREVASLLLVPSPTGLAWSRRNVSRAWDHDQAIADAALRQQLADQGLSRSQIDDDMRDRHRQRRDLRRTGIVRMAEFGCTTPQIAAVSGHSIDFCQKIIDTYLPRRTEVALGGIEAWEIGEKGGSRLVRLSDAAFQESEAQRGREKTPSF